MKLMHIQPMNKWNQLYLALHGSILLNHAKITLRTEIMILISYFANEFHLPKEK